MLGIRDADSAEHGTASENLFIVPVACPVTNRPEGAPKLWGKGKIRLLTDSRVFGIYRHEEVEEQYFCNYELNPQYRARLEAAGLRVAGVGENSEVRAVELSGHSFFIATLYQPPLISSAERPHPLIVAYLEAARENQIRTADERR